MGLCGTPQIHHVCPANKTVQSEFCEPEHEHTAQQFASRMEAVALLISRGRSTSELVIEAAPRAQPRVEMPTMSPSTAGDLEVR